MSNDGQVRNDVTGRIMKIRQDRRGYTVCMLVVSIGKQVHCKVHRLVAQAFIPNPYNHTDVDHINRIRADNRVSNLRWSTRSDNSYNRITSVGLVEHIIQLHEEGYSARDIMDMCGVKSG